MTPDPQDRFEARLLTQLRSHIEHNQPQATPGRHRRPPRPWLRPRPIAAAAAVLAAAAAAIVLATGGDGADPAYAVTPRTDGSVTVSVTSLDDAAGLEQALRDAGVHAVVRTVPEGKMCQPAAPKAGAAGGGGMMISGATNVSGASTFTVAADGIRDGDTLLITTSGDGRVGPAAISFAMVDGDDPSCTLVDAPPLPATSVSP